MTRAPVSTLASILALALAAAPLAAQEVCDLPLVARDPLGPVTSVARDGAYLYAFAGRALVVYGLADPEHPNPIGRLELDFEIRQFDVIGPLLAAAAGHDGVLLIDVSDRAHPVLASRFQTGAWVVSVDVRGSTVYAARHPGIPDPTPGALLILDAADPAAPVLVGSRIFDVGGPTNVMVRGQTALTTTGRLEILDVSDPSSPTLLGHAEVPPGRHELRVDAYGTHAYVHTSGSGHHGGDSVTVFDTSDRTNPIALTTFGYDTNEDGAIWNILVGGDRLYVTGWEWEYDPRIWVYDIANPAVPTVVGEAIVPGNIGNLARLNHTLYAAARENGTLVFDVSTPTAPTLLGRVPTSGPLSSIALEGRIALLRSHDSARAIDLRGVAAPVELPSSPLPLLSRDDPSGNHLLVRDGDLGLAADRGGLEVLDLSDPSAIVPHAYVPVAGYYGPSCAVLRGELAYVGLHSPNRIRILDLSDPTLPVTVGWYDPESSYPCPMALDGDLLLSGSPCSILDVTDPTRPSPLGTCPAESGRSPVLEGTTAYLGGDALRIYDLTDPVHPVLSGEVEILVYDLDVQHARGYVRTRTADSQPELRVYDLRDPAQIHLVGTAVLPASITALRAESGRIVVTHGDLGYSVLADCPFFADGFESGDTSAWSSTQP